MLGFTPYSSRFLKNVVQYVLVKTHASYRRKDMKYLIWFLWGVLGLLVALVAAIVIYFLFIFVASFFISTKKEYNKDSRFYRFLLHSSTGIGMRIMRIRYDLVDLDKIPEGKQVYVYLPNRVKELVVTTPEFNKTYTTFTDHLYVIEGCDGSDEASLKARINGGGTQEAIIT